MKLGVITDIHNNLTALRAVVERLRYHECDRIICCGDIIGIGPYPEETVQYMMQIPNLIAVRGNYEKYFLEKLPYRIDVEYEGYILSVIHYCMDYEGHYINYKTNPSEEDLKKMFAGIVKIESGNVEVEPINVEYDVNDVIRVIDENNYPDADNIKNFFVAMVKQKYIYRLIKIG